MFHTLGTYRRWEEPRRIVRCGIVQTHLNLRLDRRLALRGIRRDLHEQIM